MKKIMLMLACLLSIITLVNADVSCGTNCTQYATRDYTFTYKPIPNGICMFNMSFMTSPYDQFYAGTDVRAALWPSYTQCYNATALAGYAQAYLRYNITPAQDVVLVCQQIKCPNTAVGGGSCVNENLRLYRFYNDSFNSNTTSWNNQPVDCDSGYGCYGTNVYGGLRADNWTYAPSVTGAATWNLSKNGLYGNLLELDYRNVYLVLAEINTNEMGTMSEIMFENRVGTSCYLEANGYPQISTNTTNISVYAYLTNGVESRPLESLSVTLCLNGNLSTCWNSITNTEGMAIFYNKPKALYSALATYNNVGQVTSINAITYPYGYLWFNCTDCLTFTNHSLSGTVSYENGTNIPSATVILSGSINLTVFTNPYGHYSFNQIISGSYSVYATKNVGGYLLRSETEYFESIGNEVKDLIISAGEYTDVHILVLDGKSNNVSLGLAGVRVSLNNYVNYTDSNGTGYLHMLGRPSSFNIILTKTNYTTVSESFTTQDNPIYRTYVMFGGEANHFTLRGNAYLDTLSLNYVPDRTNITLSCVGCNSGYGPNICGKTQTTNGFFIFTNLLYKPTCYIRADYPSNNYQSTGWRQVGITNPVINPITVFSFVGLTTVGGNQTNISGLVWFKGLVKDTQGNIIYNGPYEYSIYNTSNGTWRTKTDWLSDGYVIRDNLIPGSLLKIHFIIPDYEDRWFPSIIVGSDNYEDDDLFVLKYIGAPTTTPTTTLPGQTTTTTLFIGGTSTTLTTTTLYAPMNITIYSVSNRTTSLLTNGYEIVFRIGESLCGAAFAAGTLILLFIGFVIILLANSVLKALGWKWDWIFGGR